MGLDLINIQLCCVECRPEATSLSSSFSRLILALISLSLSLSHLLLVSLFSVDQQTTGDFFGCIRPETLDANLFPRWPWLSCWLYSGVRMDAIHPHVDVVQQPLNE